jgi:hypothetical protein
MRRTRSRSTWVAAIAAAAMAALVPLWAARADAAPATNTDVKIIAAHIDGKSLFDDTRENPVPISPLPEVPFSLTVENTGDVPVEIRYVRITGAMLGIRFVRFQATTKETVPAHSVRTFGQPADFFDVDRAASGYINSSMQVVDADRNTLASKGFVADVEGKFLSSEGVLLIEVIVFALIGIVQIMLGLYRRGLSPNRFYRAMLFAITFGSAAVAIVIGIAMLRIGLLRPTTWVPAVLLTTAAGFVLGYLSPGRLERRADDESEEKVLDLVAAEAVARASGQHERRTTGGSVPHTSGDHTGVTTGHPSGEHEAHESGKFAPHTSGGYTPQHESGPQEPLQ